MNIVGLIFYTVYGPWVSPDMALFNFTRNISIGNKVELFNYGNHYRDFTYIDDAVQMVLKLSTSKINKKFAKQPAYWLSAKKYEDEVAKIENRRS